jgi:hypothetical protein
VLLVFASNAEATGYPFVEVLELRSRVAGSGGSSSDIVALSA